MKRVAEFFKRLWERILNPSIVQAIIVSVVGCAFIAVAVVLSLAGVGDAGAYCCYALALLALIYIIYIFIYGYPRVKQRTLEFAKRYEFTENLVENYGYRTMVLTCVSIALNAIYGIYNAALAAHYMSLASALLAAYYLLLGALRGGLIYTTREKGELIPEKERRKKSIKSYINCGIFLIVFTLLIVGAMVRLTIFGGDGQSVYLIFVSGVYTLVRFSFAVLNINKAKKYSDFGTKALRNINFADALVALYSLQMSVVSAYGEGDNLQIFNAVTGGAVCVIMIVMSVHMVVNGRRAFLKEE